MTSSSYDTSDLSVYVDRTNQIQKTSKLNQILKIRSVSDLFYSIYILDLSLSIQFLILKNISLPPIALFITNILLSWEYIKTDFMSYLINAISNSFRNSYTRFLIGPSLRSYKSISLLIRHVLERN